ncbi:MAG: tetratricopeptide repeat protein [Bacteroidaceae bacterium]|nr:tetratricopeptide repeat protein [Bacteroidaceae bacterium]
MKKKRILSLAAGLLLMCSSNFAFGQAVTDVPQLSGDEQQDAQSLLNAVEGNKAVEVQRQTKSIIKKYKKDENALNAIGYFFFKNKQYDEAIFFAKAAYERNNKSLPSILLEGDSYYEQKKFGEAVQKYEEAIYNNPEDKRAYFKRVSVYKYINPQLALETMETIKKKYPKDPAIDKTMASIYYHLNDTAKANTTYKTYFKAVKYEDDVEAAKEFAIIMFLNKDYAESYNIVNKIISQDPKEISLNRMKFYDLIEMGKYQDAEVASKNFFGQYVDTLYNFSDYKYMGKLQAELKNIDGAVAAYKKASDLAPEDKKPALLKDLSLAYETVGKYDDAAATYQQFIDLAAPGSLVETYNKGRIFYKALEDSTITADQRKHYIEAGDALFKVVAAKDSSYLGPFWSARINSALDPNNPNEVAMQQYNEAFKRLESKDASYNSRRVECLRYMTFYYFKKDDMSNCVAYADKVLALSPDDSLAKQIKVAVSQLKKK